MTGQVGLEKGQYLNEAQGVLEQEGISLKFLSVGEEILKASGEALDDKTILNLPRRELDALRALAWHRINAESAKIGSEQILVVSSHAVLRWHQGLFLAIELDLVQIFAPDMIVTLIDDVDVVARNLDARGTPYFELWEMMAWREEEVVLTKFLCNTLSRMGKKEIPIYILPRQQGAKLFSRILTEEGTPKIYLSFSVTDLADELQIEVKEFKKRVMEEYIAFDPLAMAERSILTVAESTAKEIDEVLKPGYEGAVAKLSSTEDQRWQPAWNEYSALGLADVMVGKQSLPGSQINSIRSAIDDQIISRDYWLIDQSDFVLMFISATDDGHPRISAGSQSEMLYAYSHGKPIYGICEGGEKSLSPWVTQFSRIFTTLSEALEFLHGEYPLNNNRGEPSHV